jgi:signal transduction histidine kinase
VASFLFSIFVFAKAPNRKLAVRFVWYALCISFWSFFVFLCTSVSHHKVSYLFAQICHAVGVFIPLFFLHFVIAFVDHRSRVMSSILKLAYALIGLISAVIVFAPRLFLQDVVPKLTFHYFPIPGPLFHLWTLLFGLLVMLAFGVLHVTARKKKELERKRINAFILANLLGYAGGIGCFFPVYNIAFFPFPYGSWGVFFFVCVTCYATYRFKFIDIDVVLRRTLVFAGLVSFVFGVFACTTFIAQELLSRHLGQSHKVSFIVSIFIVVFAYDPLRKLLVHTTDRFLFQKRFDYQKLLKDASAGISKIKSLHHLLSLVVHFVTMRVRVKNAAVIMYEPDSHAYRFCFPRGYDDEHRVQGGMLLDEHDPLIDYMLHEHVPIDADSVREWLEPDQANEEKKEFNRVYNFRVIQMRMQELDASCCVPSFLGKELRNVLVLGEKKSGGGYTEQDLQVLYTLAQESAIAIENARLYDQAVEKAKELEVINSQLSQAQNQLIQALNETEVANKKLRDTHAQLIHEQKMATLGRLASSVGHEVNNPLTILSMNVSRAILKFRRNPDLKVSDIMDTFGKMEQNISRIKAVVNTLTGLLKKSEHGKFEPLSLKLILEETLPLVQFQTYLENLSGTEVEFDIPGSLPLIKGDLERLQEVFLNLFINAYHAMVGRRDRKIVVTASEHPAHPATVLIEFSDNGSGMSDEVMKKIFSYGFTTKPTGKGSGMGLYMCHYIIELHGGEIKVRSKEGEGTTFVITLPSFIEQTQAESTTKETN